MERLVGYCMRSSRSLLARPSELPGLSTLAVCRGFAALPDGTPMVSSHGRVRSLRNVISWGTPNGSGYLVTSIGGNKARVHRLVARAFIGLPPSTQHCDINHKDGNKQNNHVSNLEYATRSQNILHSYGIGRRTCGEAFSKPVIGRLRGTHHWNLPYSSAAEAARELNLLVSSVSKCCRGVLGSTGGFEFQFADPGVREFLPGECWKIALHPDTGAQLLPWKVSSSGRILSSRTLGWGTEAAGGYRKANIRVHDKYYNMYVHRLVARTFLGPPPSAQRSTVNHKDGVPSNNHINNLEYASRSEITQCSYVLRGAPARPASRKPVLISRPGQAGWVRFPSVAAAAEDLKIHASLVSRILHSSAHQQCDYTLKWADCEDMLPGEEWQQMVYDV